MVILPSYRLTELLVPSSIGLFMCKGRRACSMQAAESPDQDEDRDRHAEQPQQHIASHCLGSIALSVLPPFGQLLANALWRAEFRGFGSGGAAVRIRLN